MNRYNYITNSALGTVPVYEWRHHTLSNGESHECYWEGYLLRLMRSNDAIEYAWHGQILTYNKGKLIHSIVVPHGGCPIALGKTLLENEHTRLINE